MGVAGGIDADRHQPSSGALEPRAGALRCARHHRPLGGSGGTAHDRSSAWSRRFRAACSAPCESLRQRARDLRLSAPAGGRHRAEKPVHHSGSLRRDDIGRGQHRRRRCPPAGHHQTRLSGAAGHHDRALHDGALPGCSRCGGHNRSAAGRVRRRLAARARFLGRSGSHRGVGMAAAVAHASPPQRANAVRSSQTVDGSPRVAGYRLHGPAVLAGVLRLRLVPVDPAGPRPVRARRGVHALDVGHDAACHGAARTGACHAREGSARGDDPDACTDPGRTTRLDLPAARNPLDLDGPAGSGAGWTLQHRLTLLVLRSPDAHVAAHLSGMAQTVGYTFAALGPLALGVLHEWRGDWSAVGPLFTAITAAAFLAAMGAGRNQLVAATSRPLRSAASA